MKNKKTLILLIVLLPLLASKCGDNVFTPKPDQLPPITQTGAKTFGCLIDGEVFIPEKTLPFAPIIQTDLFDTTSLKITTGKNHEFVSLYIQMDNLNNLQLLDTFLIIYFDSGNEDYSDCTFESNTQFGSCIQLSKFDTVNRIVAGTFEAKLVVDEKKDTCTNIIHITEGRFDVRY